MTVSKTLLAAGTAALIGAPVWALPSQALSHPSGPPASTPNDLGNPGASHRSSAATDALEDRAEEGNHANNGKHQGSGTQSPSNPGKSHRCKPHRVAYVASGTLESWSLTPTSDDTFSGSVTVHVTHTNHHAANEEAKTPTETKVYPLERVHLTFGLADTNNDGSVGLDDLAKGDPVQLIGKITSLAKKCSHTGFTATTTIRHIVFHAPSPG
jgi:hypothetical protein